MGFNSGFKGLNFIIQFVRKKNEDKQVSPSVTAQVLFQDMCVYIYIVQSLVLSAAYIEG